jgi:hypothetical protein
VGDHEGAVLDGERLVSHRFAATMKGYRGWSWVVTLARVPRGRTGTVCEVELLPSDGALLAPDWLPWADRLRPGDIGAGDVLPFKVDDPRLEPGYVSGVDAAPADGSHTDDTNSAEDAVAIEELPLARMRVLSPLGREEAAQRWYRGSQGPTSRGAVAASASCQTCGFLVPLSGALGQVFAVCANEWSPDDGKVVSYDHGCGAHSETGAEPSASQWPDPDPLVDEMLIERMEPLAPSESSEPDGAPGESQVEETRKPER